uniref:GDNF/GAS1 domain-containing protein n=1 Tax=Gorilla gorilla gorilla TaxID=9595 RepID=A0A2I2Z7I5_GORGO
MVRCLGPALLLLLLLGSLSSVGGNRCVDAAEACTADARCQRLRSEYVAQCLGRAAQGGCPRARCRRAPRRFFARGPPALTHPRRLPAGPGRPLPARLRGPRGVPAGTAVTPNYVDNVSARVAPWCDCGASGNRREDCEAFRGLFTRNRCLDGAIQAFASGWPPVLLDQLNPQGDPEHSLLQVSSTGRALERRSLLSILPVLALPALL